MSQNKNKVSFLSKLYSFIYKLFSYQRIIVTNSFIRENTFQDDLLILKKCSDVCNRLKFSIEYYCLGRRERVSEYLRYIYIHFNRNKSLLWRLFMLKRINNVLIFFMIQWLRCTKSRIHMHNHHTHTHTYILNYLLPRLPSQTFFNSGNAIW